MTNKDLYILGINAYHGDSSACILKNGELLAATEEERFRRIKHWAGFPSMAIAFCLKEAGITIEEVDHIAISRDPKAQFSKKIIYTLKHGVGPKTIIDRLKNRSKVKSIKQEFSLALDIAEEKITAPIHNVEHHRSHLASAFYASPYEEAALLSIDGMGDFTSTMTGRGKGLKMEIYDQVHYPHSLGIFYTSLTQYLGFPHYGDEYKVMGLAPYGEPKYMDKLWEVIHKKDDGLFELNLDYFTHAKKGVSMAWEGGSPTIESIFSKKLETLLGPARQNGDELTQYHKDLATSIQRVCEEVIFHIMSHLQKKTGLKKICIAGGVAQNSVANGKMTERTGFDEIYIPSAGHDAGTAMGAAYYVYNEILQNPRVNPIWNAYTGYQATNEEIENALAEENQVFVKYDSESELVDKISDYLIDGKVIGWYQGRAEFGPRALGHRSIIVDPRRMDAKELLNSKIKRRESFRPFAPSILEECVGDYFEKIDKVPFMEKVFPIKQEKHAEIPAVTHVDGTGRLQTVAKGDRYHTLISKFYEKSGVPILLNTSFNENEPIVNTPEEALACYLRTEMDVLVMNDYVISRKTN